MSIKQSLRAASLHSLSLVFAALGGLLGLVVMATMEGWLPFPIGIVLGLYVATLIAYHNVRRERDELKAAFGPKLLAIRCQFEVWQLIEAGASGPHATCNAWSVVFQNDPERPDESSQANVLADISYEINGNEVVRLNGRWGETRQPIEQLTVIPRPPIVDLERVSIDIGQKRVLHLAVNMPDGHWYSFNNESYRDNFDNPKFRLFGGPTVTICVRLRGVHVDAKYLFTLGPLSDKEARLTLIDSQPRPIAGKAS